MQYGSLNVTKKVERDQIQTKLMVETWLWEKEQSHRLFNFHEGYRKYDDYSNQDTEIIGSYIIKKNGPNDISFLQASEHKEKFASQN